MAAPEAEGGGVRRLAPLGPEQLRRVLELVTRARPPPVVLRDAARQAAPRRGPGPASPRLPPQLEAICVKVTSGGTRGPERPMSPLATVLPHTVRPGLPPGRSCILVGRHSSSPQLPRGQLHAPRASVRPVLASSPPAPEAASDRGSSFHTEKLKRPFKVRTRSGRVSRPPKHKARDYKFIKTEDLADGHVSDSDDYSELSVEEDEDQKGKQALFDLASCSLRPKTFKCQSCEKSYIGKGGLARHFKLNPGHGVLIVPEQANADLTQQCVGTGAMGCTSPELPAPAKEGPLAGCAAGAEPAWHSLQVGQSVDAEEVVPTEPENQTHSVLGSRSLPGAQGSRCPATPAEPLATAAPPWQGTAAASRARAWRGRAQLLQLLEQSDQEDLMQLALPQLARAVTLYEFLLLKVEEGRLAKPLFPAVYKEFEELHVMVKKLCQDYLGSCSPSAQEPLEINDRKVAESLGITDEFLSKQEVRMDRPARQRTSQETDGKQPEGASGQKRGGEATEDLQASVKRTRTAAPPEDTAEAPATHGPGCKQPPPLGAPGAREGSAPTANGQATPHFEDSQEVAVQEGRSTLCTGQQLEQVTEMQIQSGCAGPDVQARSGCAGPVHPCLDCRGPSVQIQLREPRFPGQKVQEPSSGQDTGVSMRGPAACGTPLTHGGAESLLPGSPQCAEDGHHKMHHVPPGHQQARASPILWTGASAPPPEKAVSQDCVPVDYACRTVPEPGPQLPTKVGLKGHIRDLNQASCGLEGMVAVGSAMASKIPGGGNELLSPEREQLCIQMSQPSVLPAVTPVAVLQGRVAEGVPLAAVDTLLIVQAEPAQRQGAEPGLWTGLFEANKAFSNNE